MSLIEQYSKQINLATGLVNTRSTHDDYKRVTELADKYKALITGEGIEKYLKQYAPREDEIAFKQRCDLTNAITPAVANSIMKPFNRVTRTDKVKARHDFKNKAQNRMISEMMKTFYGSKRGEKGLDLWLKTRFLELTFTNPNAWVVLEWSAPAPNVVPAPYPVEYNEHEVLNYKHKKQELLWLFTTKSTIIKTLKADNTVSTKEAVKYILYERNCTIVFKEICKDLDGKEPVEYNPDYQFKKEINGKYFLISVLEPKLGYVPAFRVGYKRDLATGGRTFVNPFQPAMPYFDKSIKTVSEFDLTMTLHVFPQKMQYVENCTGESSTRSCVNGKVPSTGATCKVCNGSGLKVHKSAQDLLVFKKPEDPKDMVNLNDLLVYKTPPIELIEFQKKYIEDLEVKAHTAIFNSTMFVVSEIQKTATEVDYSMQSIYDTIEPFTEKISEVWKEVVSVFAGVAAVKDLSQAVLFYIFPNSLQLKTTSVLLQELKAANESNAPSFLRDSINSQIAEIVYTGDDEGLIQYNVKRYFFPFNGKTADEIAMLINSDLVSKDTKILYSNFDQIFNDIEKEVGKRFWYLNASNQWEVVQKKIVQIKEEIDRNQPIILNFHNEIDRDEVTGAAPDNNNPLKGTGNEIEEDNNTNEL